SPHPSPTSSAGASPPTSPSRPSSPHRHRTTSSGSHTGPSSASSTSSRASHSAPCSTTSPGTLRSRLCSLCGSSCLRLGAHRACIILSSSLLCRTLGTHRSSRPTQTPQPTTSAIVPRPPRPSDRSLSSLLTPHFFITASIIFPPISPPSPQHRPRSCTPFSVFGFLYFECVAWHCSLRDRDCDCESTSLHRY
ncbi:hypothetical protein AB1N83_011481, partial [Pleurotus pulmonarius]